MATSSSRVRECANIVDDSVQLAAIGRGVGVGGGGRGGGWVNFTAHTDSRPAAHPPLAVVACLQLAPHKLCGLIPTPFPLPLSTASDDRHMQIWRVRGTDSFERVTRFRTSELSATRRCDGVVCVSRCRTR